MKGQTHIANMLREIQQIDIGAMKSLYSHQYLIQQSDFCNNISRLFFSLEIYISSH